jgi:MerR family transcriptional regulator, copper efflux regulator
MDTPPQPLACTLKGADLSGRLRAWSQVVARATSRRVEHGRVVATYPNDAQLLGRLRELIAAEADCCSFLDFRLEETPDAIVIELRLPEGVPASIAGVFGGCVSRAARPASRPDRAYGSRAAP